MFGDWRTHEASHIGDNDDEDNGLPTTTTTTTTVYNIFLPFIIIDPMASVRCDAYVAENLVVLRIGRLADDAPTPSRVYVVKKYGWPYGHV